MHLRFTQKLFFSIQLSVMQKKEFEDTDFMYSLFRYRYYYIKYLIIMHCDCSKVRAAFLKNSSFE